jgi:hypothetical protein
MRLIHLAVILRRDDIWSGEPSTHREKTPSGHIMFLRDQAEYTSTVLPIIDFTESMNTYFPKLSAVS